MLKDSEGESLIWWHSVNYRERRGEPGFLNRGFWLHIPRPVLLCRIFEHRKVIDGTSPTGNSPGYRWACCDRCGLRPSPQGSFSPETWNIGDNIPDPMPGSREVPLLLGVEVSPGEWPRLEKGTIGCQLILGRSHSCGFSFKVGSAGSEHTLAAHAGLPFLGAIYLHTERFGTWLQRRLVPDGYESRITELDVYAGRLRWKIWDFRDSSRPSWRNKSIRIDPRDIFLGEKRYTYKVASNPVKVTLALPGDTQCYEVVMQLKLQTLARKRGNKQYSWVVDCDSETEIPYRNSWKGGMTGWSVKVGGNELKYALHPGLWSFDAVKASIEKIEKLREDYNWKAKTANVTE